MQRNRNHWGKTATTALIASMMLCTSASTRAADPRKGEETYRQYCSMCHGEGGHKAMPSAPDLYRGEGMFQSDLSLVRRIEDGKNACPSFRGILKQQDILDVIAHIRMLRR